MNLFAITKTVLLNDISLQTRSRPKTESHLCLLFETNKQIPVFPSRQLFMRRSLDEVIGTTSTEAVKIDPTPQALASWWLNFVATAGGRLADTTNQHEHYETPVALETI